MSETRSLSPRHQELLYNLLMGAASVQFPGPRASRGYLEQSQKLSAQAASRASAQGLSEEKTMSCIFRERFTGQVLFFLLQVAGVLFTVNLTLKGVAPFIAVIPLLLTSIVAIGVRVAAGKLESPYKAETFPVASPCVAVCKVSPHGICQGCGRTLAEISRWRTMTDPEKANCKRMARARLQNTQ